MELSELTLDRDGLARAIACEDASFESALRANAYRTKVAAVGPEVYLRGLIEISNRCVKRKSTATTRFTMTTSTTATPSSTIPNTPA